MLCGAALFKKQNRDLILPKLYVFFKQKVKPTKTMNQGLTNKNKYQHEQRMNILNFSYNKPGFCTSQTKKK
jgi:hypothetical protein